MSRSPSDKADPAAIRNGGDSEYPAGRPRPEAGAGPRHDATAVVPSPASPGNMGQVYDHRLRGIRSGPTGDVPVISVGTDHRIRQRRRPLLAIVVVFVAVAALAVLLLQTFVIQPFTVHGDAMTPTLLTGDRILVLKPGLLTGPIRSGDVIVFHLPKSPSCVVGSGSGDMVRRVVAMPGEVIWSAGDTIFVDGRPLRDMGWYDHRFGQVGSTPVRRTTLGAGRYFVLADNRSDACDSRAFGPISESSVVGEGIAVVARHGHVSFGTL
jgi:signal peptidase I